MQTRVKAWPALKAVLAIAALTLVALPGAAQAALRVCADPGNMPLSNNRGEGLENKMAALLARALGTTVENYYRPGVERGLTRTTLYADQCDVMFDMPPDSDDVITTGPLYRSTFVLVYRRDRGFAFKNLDDPRLKTLKVGVYETSAVREALLEHGVVRNIVIHYLSHDADLVPADQPSYQVQQVIDGKLDVAAAWGPMAGYYRTIRQAPLVIQPVNLMDDEMPLEFDMAIAVRRSDHELQRRLEQAMRQERDALRAILTEYGVPLVKCDSCLISGDLPSHGPYAPPQSAPAPKGPAVSIAQLNDWLAHGANMNVELNDAVMADDAARVSYLIEQKHAAVGAQDLQGETPLHHALIERSASMVAYLIAHGADVNQRDRDGWTPLMTAAYYDDGAEVKSLVAHGADANAHSSQNLTPLGIAVQYGKNDAAVALVEAGADPQRAVGEAGYTPLMLATGNGAETVARALIGKGADVNARNSGGVTALMIAAADGNAPMVELLMRAGANARVQTDRGDTALSIARARGDERVIRLLDEHRRPGA
ncbi:MAG TPA: quinoprotein dehydrogenase-associated putative ABC transporter substrate-binding protein [Steroidobacteraceae bacterium]|jgi:quinoprotein dehydrogenase-associated probable ABC transporter substrate-binding protein|nr:quinoprotein dehydrogenase-associated putative ABC transporter substrate-binding protein [Steroidobacteraceae bacterium]